MIGPQVTFHRPRFRRYDIIVAAERWDLQLDAIDTWLTPTRA
jgi:hypothetical protein